MTIAMKLGLYIEYKGKPLAIDDPVEWVKWFESGDRHLACDMVTDAIRVSTVFFGLAHNFDAGPPLLYETRVFGGRFDETIERYSTREAALKGHERWVRKVQDSRK